MNTPSESAKSPTFERVIDGRGREVAGLCQRNGRFYCHLHIPGKGSRRIPLYADDGVTPVRTVSEAVSARNRVQHNKANGEMPMPRNTPTFQQFQEHYIDWLNKTNGKAPPTIKKEKSALKGWSTVMGGLKINQIDRRAINDYVLLRKQGGVTNRTINLDVLALNNCLEFARKEDWLRRLPTEDWEALSHAAPKRSLITQETIDKLCSEALRREGDQPVYENGELLSDYIRLLAVSGIRRQAGYTARWSNVDFDKKQLTVQTKYKKTSIVDFNPKLESHLRYMEGKKLPDTDWLFPSPRRGPKGHITNFHKTFDKVRVAVGCPNFQLHDLRHYFISYCIMSGVDSMQIAEWCSHSDGGVLIGRVYGHLNDEHRKKMAGKVSFGNAATPAPAALADLDLTKITAADLLKLLQKTPP